MDTLKTLELLAKYSARKIGFFKRIWADSKKCNWANEAALRSIIPNIEKMARNMRKSTQQKQSLNQPQGGHNAKPFITTHSIGIDKHSFSLILGTFSKTCSPAMRLGFIVSKNTEILKQLSVAKEASDLHSNTFAQYLIWDYLKHNDYEKHIAKIRALYQSQAHAMLEAMEQYFPKNVCWTKPEGGMFLWVTLPKNVSTMQLFPKALEQKVVFVPGDCFYINSKDMNTMRLNYTNASCEMIQEGIKRLASVLNDVC